MIASNRKLAATTTFVLRAILEAGAGWRGSFISLRKAAFSLRKAARFCSPTSISFQLLESSFGPGTKPVTSVFTIKVWVSQRHTPKTSYAQSRRVTSSS